MRDIGKRLQRARIRAGLTTQVAGAARCRLPVSSICAYENETREPGARALRQICRRYGVSADWLLGTGQSAAQ